MTTDIEHKPFELLAEYLGVETSDLNFEDTLSGSLHMSPSDISDFMVYLSEHGLNVSQIDIAQLETIGDLLEKISAEEMT